MFRSWRVIYQCKIVGKDLIILHVAVYCLFINTLTLKNFLTITIVDGPITFVFCIINLKLKFSEFFCSKAPRTASSNGTRTSAARSFWQCGKCQPRRKRQERKRQGKQWYTPNSSFWIQYLKCTLSTKHNATIVWSYFMQNLSLQKPTEKSMCYF